MIDIAYDLTTGVAKLATPVIIKPVAGIPVRVTFSAAPASAGDFALSLGSDAAPPVLAAYADAFVQESDLIWTGSLDASDARLTSQLNGKGSLTLNAEFSVTVNGDPQTAPNFQLTVQPLIRTGPATSEGGPSYLTATEVAAAIASAIANLAPRSVVGKYRILNNGTVELWNPAQSKYHALSISGAAGAETITLGAGEI